MNGDDNLVGLRSLNSQKRSVAIQDIQADFRNNLERIYQAQTQKEKTLTREALFYQALDFDKPKETKSPGEKDQFLTTLNYYLEKNNVQSGGKLSEQWQSLLQRDPKAARTQFFDVVARSLTDYPLQPYLNQRSKGIQNTVFHSSLIWELHTTWAQYVPLSWHTIASERNVSHTIDLGLRTLEQLPDGPYWDSYTVYTKVAGEFIPVDPSDSNDGGLFDALKRLIYNYGKHPELEQREQDGLENPNTEKNYPALFASWKKKASDLEGYKNLKQYFISGYKNLPSDYYVNQWGRTFLEEALLFIWQNKGGSLEYLDFVIKELGVDPYMENRAILNLRPDGGQSNRTIQDFIHDWCFLDLLKLSSEFFKEKSKRYEQIKKYFEEWDKRRPIEIFSGERPQVQHQLVNPVKNRGKPKTSLWSELSKEQKEERRNLKPRRKDYLNGKITTDKNGNLITN
jgi:hypothetical protein